MTPKLSPLIGFLRTVVVVAMLFALAGLVSAGWAS